MQLAKTYPTADQYRTAWRMPDGMGHVVAGMVQSARERAPAQADGCGASMHVAK